MEKINRYKKDVENYYKKFTDGGFGKTRLTFYDDEVDNLPEDLKNSSLACGNPLKFLEKNYIPENCRIFDLGCGGGFELSLIDKKIKHSLLAGMDYSQGMIEKCSQNIKKYCGNNTFCLRGDGEFLPFKNGSFDICISNAAINLIPDKERVFKEVKRILDEDGRFVFSDVTILTPIPEKVREKFTVMDGLYFAPTIIHWEEEIEMVKKYFGDVSILNVVDILPDEEHTEYLISQLPKLSKKERKFFKKSIMKGKYRVIEVEAFVNGKYNVDNIKCNCGKIVPTKTYQIIDIDKMPVLFREFVQNKINIFKCPDCGERSQLPVPVMINSEKLKLKSTIFPEFFRSSNASLMLSRLSEEEKVYYNVRELMEDYPSLKSFASSDKIS